VNPTRPALTALVLAGGAARRMGGAKADQPFGARTLLDCSLALATSVADETLLLAGEREVSLAGHERVRRIDDLPEGSGPLRGLAAGMSAASHEWCLLLACDMPLLTPHAVHLLLEHALRTTPAEDGVMFVSARGWEPFPALLRRRALATVLRRLLAADHSLQALASDLVLRRVELSELRGIDPDLRSLSNVNTPLDLRSALELAAETAP
jgi:molybdenum cofactor guanylyltransferase